MASGSANAVGQNAFPFTVRLEGFLPDETLFSWCSRYHFRATNGRSEVTCQQLFGDRRQGSAHDLPSQIDALVERTGGLLGDTEHLILGHTILPFYLPFRPMTLYHHAMARMRGAGIGSLKFRLGLLTSGLAANHPLKACPACMADDEADHGVAYWHRAHQFPGVLLCPRHHLQLLHSPLKTERRARFDWVLPRQASLGLRASVATAHDAPKQGLSGLGRLARMSLELVQSKPAAFSDPQRLARTLRTRLEARALARPGRQLKWSPILESARNHFSHLPRQLIEGKFLHDLMTEASIKRLLTGRALSHPIRYLVLIEWLFDDWQAFERSYQDDARTLTSPHLMGVKPGTPCHPRKQQALDMLRVGTQTPTAIASELGVDVATVAAWAAELGYRPRRRPKALKASVMASLLTGLQDGRDKADLAVEAGVSVESVTRIMRSEPGLAERWHQAREDKRRESARANWAALIAQLPGVSIRVVRALARAEYAWLYRNDRDWLKTSINERPSKPVRINHAAARMQNLDQRLASTVERTAAEIAARNGMRKMTWDVLVAAIPELERRQEHLARFPMTARALDRVLIKT